MQLGEHNVRVNSISPGGIATGIFGKALGLSIEKAEQTAEAIKAGLAGMQPIPRAGLTDDIASAAVFLASDESSSSTGTTWLSTAAWWAAGCGHRSSRR